MIVKIYCPCEINMKWKNYSKLLGQEKTLDINKLSFIYENIPKSDYIQISNKFEFFKEINELIINETIIDENLGIPFLAFDEKYETLEEKIINILPSIDEKESMLWLVLSISLKTELTTEEKDLLKEYVSAQLEELTPVFVEAKQYEIIAKFYTKDKLQENKNILLFEEEINN